MPTVFRYASFFFAAIILVNLLIGRRRAVALVAEGRITQAELDRFIRGCALLFGGAFVTSGVLQLLGGYPDPFCLTRFPPATGYGVALWLGQAAISGWVIWWLWVRDGARILAAVAPAFTSGPVPTRTYSPARVRLLVTAILVMAPLGNILLQLKGPRLPGCAAVTQSGAGGDGSADALRVAT